MKAIGAFLIISGILMFLMGAGPAAVMPLAVGIILSISG